MIGLEFEYKRSRAGSSADLIYQRSTKKRELIFFCRKNLSHTSIVSFRFRSLNEFLGGNEKGIDDKAYELLKGSIMRINGF